MRIDRLDLIRFGAFTDARLTFPAPRAMGSGPAADLHLILGPNEAGKSTALAAIENLLFGIGHNSPFNFQHDYKALRLGGRLTHAGATLDIQRRKGNQNTLLDRDGQPLPGGDAALAPLLGGADAAFFARMFNLSHQRLRAGGQAMLDARDDAGVALFAAGAGLGHLHRRLEALTEEAEALWAPRKATRRAYYQAADALADADRAVRDATLTTTAWEAAQTRLAEADQTLAHLNEEIEATDTARRRLARLRRITPGLRRHRAITTTLAALAAVPTLPEDASARLDAALTAARTAQTRIEALAPQEERLRAERAALGDDSGLLTQAEAIAALQTLAARVQAQQAALPEIRAEMAALAVREAALTQAIAEALGAAQSAAPTDPATDDPAPTGPAPTGPATDDPARPASGPGSGLATRGALAEARRVLTAHGARRATLAAADQALADARADRTAREEALARAPALPDPGPLAAVLDDTTRESGDLATRRSQARDTVAEAESRLARRLARLRPAVAEAATLATMPLPDPAILVTHRDTWARLEDEARQLETARITADQERQRLTADIARLTAARPAIAPGVLDRARAARDALWQVIRRRHLDPLPATADTLAALAQAAGLDEVPEVAPLAALFQDRVAAADSVADERLAHAEAAGTLAALADRLARLADDLAGIDRAQEALTHRRTKARADWVALWIETPISPADPATMISWRAEIAAILDDLDQRDRAARTLADLDTAEAEGRARLVAALADLGPGFAPGSGPDPGLDPGPGPGLDPGPGPTAPATAPAPALPPGEGPIPAAPVLSLPVLSLPVLSRPVLSRPVLSLPADAPLGVVRRLAEQTLRRLETEATRRQTQRDQLTELRAEEGRKAARHDRARADLADWSRQWNEALAALGLPPALAPDRAGAVLDLIEERGTVIADQARLARDSLAQAEQTAAALATQVAALTAAWAPDLVGAEPLAAVATLGQRRDEARRLHDQRRDKDRALAALAAARTRDTQARTEALATLEVLHTQAGVREPEALAAVIAAADHQRDLDRQRLALEIELTTIGDGLSLADLMAEAAAAQTAGEDNPDRLAAREETLAAHLDHLRQRLADATEARAEARRAVAALDGNPTAARAAARRQDALADMQAIAGRYLRTYGAGLLLRWALERHRRTHETPLLAEAGGLFARLTVGSFSGLGLDFGADDRPHLVGIRPNDDRVPPEGMSDGTLDQMFLALRLAAVRQGLARGQSLPFVADDLFIHFDDARARAGLTVLADLARHTQVLVFTHHTHLVALARDCLPAADLQVVSLAPADAVPG